MMIVAFPAGSTSDVLARILAEPMKGALGQPVIIENVSGAGGSIGTGRVARATPDGYTIELGYLSTHVHNGAFYSLPYDVLNDFEPILPVTTNPVFLFAGKTMPANNLNELIVWLKANPNKATAGIWSPGGNLLFAMLQKETGTHLTLVPYRGEAPAMQDLIAGQIDVTITGPLPLPLVRAGSMKAYAVMGDTRWVAASDIPTFAEMGLPALSYLNWYGFFAPRGTPKDIIGKLHAAAAGALTDPAVRSRLADLGLEVFPREQQTPEALRAMQKADAKKWWPLIKELGITAE
jgi:tripartite-type tricarboxylate transporter receptor subunit TctC